MNIPFKKTQNKWLLILILTTIGCNKLTVTSDPDVNPQIVFEDAWKAMDRNYALFPLKGIDWDSAYEAGKPGISQSTDNAGLFTVLAEMLNSLRDGHVTLISESDTSTYEGFYKDYPANFNLENIKKNYLKDDFSSVGPFIYKIQNGIGYLYDGDFREPITETDLDQVMNDLAGTRGLIIDVRNNSGGDLVNVEILFSRFIRSRHLVKYERKKNGPGHADYAADEPFYVSPGGTFYDHPVIVLTNRKCFSACNDFVMYMSGLPAVRLVGDRTGGGGAIPTDFILRNGWKLQYSASMTLSADGTEVENGIPPDYEVNINSIDDANGRDPILEKGYDLLQ